MASFTKNASNSSAGASEPQARDYEFERYICTTETLRETIDRFGVAIIPAVLDNAECAAMENGMWQTLETWTKKWDTPIRKNKPNSWQHLTELKPINSMLIQHFGLGHAQFVWDLRQNPRCVEMFSTLWGSDPADLLVSFDGASFHMPSEVTKKGWNRSGPRLHSDQCFHRNEFECVQSWVTAFDVNEGDATLAFLEGSNQLHADFAAHFGPGGKDDWKMLHEHELDFYRSRGCAEMYIRCPKGSMVLWDSRTIHCGVEPARGRAASNFRCVVYLCYMPRYRADESQLIKKRQAYEERRMTSHWPCKVKLFPLTPRFYESESKAVSPLNAPVLNDLGMRLAGY
jgi:hypothetical protein